MEQAKYKSIGDISTDILIGSGEAEEIYLSECYYSDEVPTVLEMYEETNDTYVDIGIYEVFEVPEVSILLSLVGNDMQTLEEYIDEFYTRKELL